jgi:hypothetical protein
LLLFFQFRYVFFIKHLHLRAVGRPFVLAALQHGGKLALLVFAQRRLPA